MKGFFYRNYNVPSFVCCSDVCINSDARRGWPILNVPPSFLRRWPNGLHHCIAGKSLSVVTVDNGRTGTIELLYDGGADTVICWRNTHWFEIAPSCFRALYATLSARRTIRSTTAAHYIHLAMTGAS